MSSTPCCIRATCAGSRLGSCIAATSLPASPVARPNQSVEHMTKL